VAVEPEKPPVEFGADKRCLWKTAVPPGVSSPCIHGEMIFLTASEKDKLLLLGIRRKDGQIAWKHEVPAAAPGSLHQTNSAAAATPATDGSRVYAYHAGFGLLACDYAGKEIWRHPLDTPLVVNGSGTSPIVADGKVILACDQQEGKSFLLAVDATTGKETWKTPRPYAVSAYTTPIIWQRKTGPEIIVSGSLRVTGYGLKDGQEQWFASGLEGVSVCPTPILAEGRIHVMSRSFGASKPAPNMSAGMFLADADKDGKLSRQEAPFLKKDGVFDFMDASRDGLVTPEEAQKALEWVKSGEFGLFALKDPGDAKGELKPEFTLWKHQSGIPKVASAVLVSGRIYTVQDGGMVTCTEEATGKILFDRERLTEGGAGDYFASPVSADGKIYLCSTRGLVSVIEAGTTLKVLANNSLPEPISASPALAENKIYVRSTSHLWAFGE
jgi:outer membrane protein assembly factor BamB